MEIEKTTVISSLVFPILVWGGMWGVFEATFGFLLHLLPFSIGWLIWYPVACFFILNTYYKTKRVEAVFLVGLLSACIKLCNLFLPGRIDKVLNPAISIICESIAMAAAIVLVCRFSVRGSKVHAGCAALTILCMNTFWRVLYALYLLLLIPDWMREISVIGSAEAMVTFFLVHNFFTSVLLFAAFLARQYILKPIDIFEKTISFRLSSLPSQTASYIKIATAVCLLGSSVALGMVL